MRTPTTPTSSADSSAGSALKNGSRLHNKYISASDGSLSPGSALYDTMLAVDCTFVQAEDSMLRCLPTGAFLQSTYYVDAACTQLFAYSSKCAPALKYGVDYLSATCGQANRVYNLNELTTPPAQVYVKSGASCTATPNLFTVYRMYSFGSAVPAATFVLGSYVN